MGQATDGYRLVRIDGQYNLFFLAPLNCVRDLLFQQLSLCHGTSVGPLTAYTPRCAKHDFGNRLRKAFAGLPFIILNFTPLFICYKRLPVTPTLVEALQSVG